MCVCICILCVAEACVLQWRMEVGAMVPVEAAEPLGSAMEDEAMVPVEETVVPLGSAVEDGAKVPRWLQAFRIWRDSPPLQPPKSEPKKVLQPFLKRCQKSQRIKVAKLKKDAKVMKRFNTWLCHACHEMTGDSVKIIEIY